MIQCNQIAVQAQGITQRVAPGPKCCVLFREMKKEGLRYLHPSLVTTEQQEREAAWERQEKKDKDKSGGKKCKAQDDSESEEEGGRVLGSFTRLEETLQIRRVIPPCFGSLASGSS